MLEIWKSIDEPTYLLVWILYQFWLLNLNCLASTLKFGIISTIQIGWNYSHLNIRTKFYHVLRRTFLLYLNDSMMDLTMEIEIDYLQTTVLYFITYLLYIHTYVYLKILSNFLRHFRWVFWAIDHLFHCIKTIFEFLKNGRRIQLKYSPNCENAVLKN